jgi:hypothetical protein
LAQRLNGQLEPSWRGISLVLQADCCTPQPLRLTLGWTDAGPGLKLDDASSRWPAEVLTGLGTPWNTLQPAGRMVLQTQGLALSWRNSSGTSVQTTYARRVGTNPNAIATEVNSGADQDGTLKTNRIWLNASQAF